MKTYDVRILGICTVAVLAKNEETAMELACDGISFGDFEMDEARCLEVKVADFENVKRHANKYVSEI